MNKFKIVKAEPQHAFQLAPRLRKVDRREVELCTGHSPEMALQVSVAQSDADMRWCALLDGEPVALFGAAPYPLMKDTGSIWLLASDGIYQHRKDFLECCVVYLYEMHKRYEYLFNLIHDENRITRRWLKWLGFVEGEPTTQYSVKPATFIPYFSKRH